jgi:hypothetical protein
MQAKWWPRGVVPSIPGYYLAVGHNVVGWRIGKEHPSQGSPERRFYGPIPDPPQDPPRMRRFIATHKSLGEVSGVLFTDLEGSMRFDTYSWHEGHINRVWCEESEFTEIKFLDC